MECNSTCDHFVFYHMAINAISVKLVCTMDDEIKYDNLFTNLCYCMLIISSKINKTA